MYIGSWITVPEVRNYIEGPNSIHEDSVAKSIGYKSALVGGAVLMGVADSAIFTSFGHSWYESGVYSVRHIKPVYDHEEVRVVWEEVEYDSGDKRKIRFWVEKKDGEHTTVGWAALGDPDKKLTPPWERSPSKHYDSADDILPDLHVGDKQPAFEFSFPKDFVIIRRDDIQDGNWWYRVTSPWGEPILPPGELGRLVLESMKQRKTEHRSSGTPRVMMWGGFDVVVYAPLFSEHKYHLEGRLCEKGKAGQSVFVTQEVTIEDSDGVRVAIARTTSRVLISASSTKT